MQLINLQPGGIAPFQVAQQPTTYTRAQLVLLNHCLFCRRGVGFTNWLIDSKPNRLINFGEEGEAHSKLVPPIFGDKSHPAPVGWQQLGKKRFLGVLFAVGWVGLVGLLKLVASRFPCDFLLMEGKSSPTLNAFDGGFYHNHKQIFVSFFAYFCC